MKYIFLILYFFVFSFVSYAEENSASSMMEVNTEESEINNEDEASDSSFITDFVEYIKEEWNLLEWYLSENEDSEEDFQASLQEQIVQQLGSTTLLSFEDIQHDVTREDLIQKLEEDCNILIATDDPTLFNKYFLSFLYNYFQIMFAKSSPLSQCSGVHAPYYLHARDRHSFQMVEVDERNIYFSKNAGHKTISSKFAEIINEVEGTLADEIYLTFEYNNNLYFQMNEALLTPEDIKYFIQSQSGVLLTLDNTHPLYDRTREFNREELLIILEQFLDLPVHIRAKLALKRIARMRLGVQITKQPVRGLYMSADQTILLMDLAFISEEDEDSRGESTILHEMGHALWGHSVWHGLPMNLKAEYIKLSWNGSRITSNEFVSDYSAKNVLEDFAEHFSMYIDNSEKLQRDTPIKYEWLKRYIFVNTEYFTTAMDNLKIFVSSELEDTSSPYFTHPITESISIETRSKSERLHAIMVNVSNLFDDISGVREVCISFSLTQSPLGNLQDSMYICGENFVDVIRSNFGTNLRNSNRPGFYFFVDNQYLHMSYPGMYEANYITLEDYSGNERTIRYSKGENIHDIKFYFPGTRVSKKRNVRDSFKLPEAYKQSLQENTELVVSSTLDGDSLVYVLIPEAGDLGVKSVDIYLRGLDTERELTYDIDLNKLSHIQDQFMKYSGRPAPVVPGKISLPVVVPKELPGEKYRFNYVRFFNEQFYYDGVRFINVVEFDHISDDPDETAPRPVVDDIRLTVLEGLNHEGGNITIRARIPIEGFDRGRDLTWKARMRKPDGGDIEYVSGSYSNGHILGELELKPYHLEGEYLLSYISLEEGHDNFSEKIAGWVMYGVSYKTTERFIDRGIRKTIKIKVPKPVIEAVE